MVTFFEAELNSLYTHRVGNKFNDEYVSIADKPVNIDDELFKKIMMSYFLKPLQKAHDVYRLYHPSGDLTQNAIYSIARDLFAADEYIGECSESIARHLFDVSNHPKIKSGEIYIAHFFAVQIEGELHEAIGIFKSETKETYLKVSTEGDGFAVDYEQEAINIQNLDKGCLIFNTEADKGYKVVVVDNSKDGYWKDDFLQLKVRNDSYNQTVNMIHIAKEFIENKIDESFEIGKDAKIELLNKSAKYFKERDSFDIEEFSEEVIGNDDAADLFKEYKTSVSEEFEQDIPDTFDISSPAVKKEVKAFKNTLSLDKNFKIQVLTPSSARLLEKGFDEEKGMGFYRIYFKEER